jgi:lysophospholipase L1-like esterase
VLTDYEAAWRAKDSAALSLLFAENGFVLPDYAPMVRGRAAIEELYRGKGGPLFLRAVAFAAYGKSGHILGAFSNQAGGPDGGKFVLTLEKADSGKWMIVSDMDNGNQPPPVASPGQPGRASLADVGAIGRYAAENARVLPPAANERRVVFMSDSITDFWGRRYGKFFPGQPYINRGISGQVTPQMLLRFRQDVIALRPKLVVILAGTNDIGGSLGPVDVEATHSNLISMVELARAHGIKVVLSGMTPACDYISPQTGKRPMEKLKQLNDWIKDLCGSKRRGLPGLLDCHAGWARHAAQGADLGWAASERRRLRRDGAAGRKGDCGRAAVGLYQDAGIGPMAGRNFNHPAEFHKRDRRACTIRLR